MISIQKNFLFVHIPKTAGNAMQNALRPFAEDDVVCLEPHQDGVERFELINRRTATTKHSTLREYRTALSSEEYGRLFKFCCVRNPWERAISFYFSPHRGVRDFDRADFLSFVRTIPSTKSYICEHEDQGIEEAAANVDQIMRFETLQQDFLAICNKLELGSPQLPHRNASIHGATRTYYDDESQDLVGEIFREEINFFGYRFPSG